MTKFSTLSPLGKGTIHQIAPERVDSKARGAVPGQQSAQFKTRSSRLGASSGPVLATGVQHTPEIPHQSCLPGEQGVCVREGGVAPSLSADA